MIIRRKVGGNDNELLRCNSGFFLRCEEGEKGKYIIYEGDSNENIKYFLPHYVLNTKGTQ